MKTLYSLIFGLLLVFSAHMAAQTNHYFLKIEPSGTASGILLVKPGDVIQFTAKAYEATPAGTTIEVPITSLRWSVDPATFGSITAQGQLTVATRNSSTTRGMVTAVASIGSVTIRGAVELAYDNHTNADYTFEGNVRSASGPISGAHVSVMSVGNLPFMIDGNTDANGYFRIMAPAGTYIVRASATGYIPQYFDNAASQAHATRFVTDPATLVHDNIDFLLGTGGSIRGTVVDEATGAPIEAATVFAHTSSTTRPPANTTGYRAVTDVNGNYEIHALPDGLYIVSASHGKYFTQFYDGQADATAATPVVVAAAATVDDIDFALGERHPDPVYTISGTVRNAQGSPLAGASILAELPNSPMLRWFNARSGHDGSYTLKLPAGTFRLLCSAQGHAVEFYNDVADASLATLLTLDANVTAYTGIDFSLDTHDGSIAGVVRDASGNPLANIGVTAWINGRPATNASISHYGKAVTASDGSYLIERLPPGDYIVRAFGHGFLPEYYDDVTDIHQATAVAVATQPVTGIDFQLAAGGSISGTVIDEDNNNLIAHATVIVRSLNHRFERGTRTDAHGQYSIDGLPSDDYTVFAAAHRYIGEYYDNTTDISLATAVTVSAPTAVSGVDFALTPAPVTPRGFRGTVTARSGAALLVIVEAINPESGAILSTSTDLQGNFEFAAWDNAVLRARALGHVGLYAGDTRNWKQSQWNGAASGMSFVLDAVAESGMASFDGEVRDAASGDALANAWVYGFDAEGNVYFTVTGSDGAFRIINTANGSLDLMVSEVGYDDGNASGEISDARGSATIHAQRSSVTAADATAALPATPILRQNYPNPFNPATTIAFTLPERMQVSIRIHDLLGRTVATVVDGVMDAGTHRVSFEASTLPSGIYLYRMESAAGTQARRMTLVK